MNNFRDFETYLKNFPSKDGYFGEHGGAYLPEALIPAFKEADDAYEAICHSAQFINELRRIRKEFQGRPTPVYHCERLSKLFGNCQIYLKREDLNHTGAHKLNHCMGEGLLAKYMGKKKLIAETGAGQHGVAIATAAAYFGMECDVYMGEVDIAKQPHPFPKMVRDFQSVIGIEAREQFIEMTGIMPDAVCACVGGGSNSLGMFVPFLSDPVDIYGIEPLGKGSNVGDHAATMKFGTKGRLHGFDSYVLQDENGEPLPVYSIASGLDYPGVGPEHAYLRDIGRVKYDAVTDEEAMEAFFLLSRYEGIIPAIESAHAVAFAIKYAKEHQSGSILACLSGRGDKDIDYVYENYGCGEKFNLNYEK